MTPPLVDVVIVHYERPHELAETMQSLRKNLRYPNLRWVVADDHSSQEALEFVRNQVQPDILFCTKERSGLGLNTNNALRTLESDFIFLTMDDRVLEREIDLRPGVDVLARFPQFGMVRYSGMEGHVTVSQSHELAAGSDSIFPDAPRFYTVYEISKKRASILGPFSLYVYSGEPHLKHRRFHEVYGLYKEGYKVGPTEEDFAHRFLAMEGPNIVYFPEFLVCPFKHIGHSWQHTEHDIGWAGGHW